MLIIDIKGIGKERAKLFNKIGIYNVYDLITYIPRSYEDRTNIKLIEELDIDKKELFLGIVVSRPYQKRINNKMQIISFNIKDETSIIKCVIFNRPYLLKQIKINDKYLFFGEIRLGRQCIEVINPDIQKIINDIDNKSMGILPLYKLTKGLSQNVIRKAIKIAFPYIKDYIYENIPQDIRKKEKLIQIYKAYRSIHFPESFDELEKAEYRLSFNEVFVLQLALLYLKNYRKNKQKAMNIEYKGYSDEIIKKLPFKLTNAQKRVIEEVKKDLFSKKPMNRLIQGDVGSGKTVIAITAMYIAAKNGYQAAFMAPTEILAQQHFVNIKKIFEGNDIKLELLSSGLKASKKKEIKEKLFNGNIDILIGTHAIIQDDVDFKNLGIIITDEQHRFGVKQRRKLEKKGMEPDILVMTATPIPRTLTMIVYGDLDISIIDELPPNRIPVKTYIVDESKRSRINKFIKGKIDEGRQVFYVCPLILESESLDFKSAEEVYENLKEEIFKEYKIGLIHGKMKPIEKEEIMNSFKIGDYNILVATTVIEVGIDIPNAVLMIIENANRFGLSQLHQLRGRVGRGSDESYCILFASDIKGKAGRRLNIIKNTNDGFKISQEDLKIRGPGQYLGTMQHGIPELKAASIFNNIDVIKKAKDLATDIIQNELLNKKEYIILKKSVDEYLKRIQEEISLN